MCCVISWQGGFIWNHVMISMGYLMYCSYRQKLKVVVGHHRHLLLPQPSAPWFPLVDPLVLWIQHLLVAQMAFPQVHVLHHQLASAMYPTRHEMKHTLHNWVVLMKIDQSKYLFVMRLMLCIYANVLLHKITSHLPPSQGGKYTGFGNPACEYLFYFIDLVEKLTIYSSWESIFKKYFWCTWFTRYYERSNDCS